MHEKLIRQLAENLQRNYVFEEAANTMHNELIENWQNGRYDSLDPGESLAELLESDLRRIVNDKHLAVRYGAPNTSGTGQFNGREIKKLPNGMGEAQILEGNIGYWELTGFENSNTQYRGLVATNMARLANTQAIILDLRNNGGGSPAGVQLVSTYFFPVGENIHLNTLYFRNSDSSNDFYTLGKVEGDPMPDTPVYILTSDYTFSAGEEFCYNLKHLGRATVVGETTGGGAHPVETHYLPDGMRVVIPSGRAINPITGTNWEGVGVVPHYEVSEEDALQKALDLISDK